jgi:hypothetical protein
LLSRLQAASQGSNQGSKVGAGGGPGTAARIAADLLKQTAGEEEAATLAHLESSLAASIVLGSPADYRHWLQNYVRFLSPLAAAAVAAAAAQPTPTLADNGAASAAGAAASIALLHPYRQHYCRLRELCDELLGQPAPSASLSSALLSSLGDHGDVAMDDDDDDDDDDDGEEDGSLW